MPFDLAAAAHALRARHGDAMGFRQTLLDHLFAAGCGVREQAVALEFGDALCVRTSSADAAPGSPLCVFAIDLDPLGSARDPRQPPPRWPPHLASLGGADVAIGWLATLRALLSTDPQRPWQMIYLRGPALGLADYVETVHAALPEAAHCVQLAPSVAVADAAVSLDLLRLDLTRSHNIWRFAACDFTYALTAQLPDGEAFSALQHLISDLDTDAFTLHDLHLQPGEPQRLTATLRTARPIDRVPARLALSEADASQRLTFPVNDAWAALQAMAPKLAEPWRGAVQRPLHAAARADGLCLHAAVPAGLDADALPQERGDLALSWSVQPLARAAQQQHGLATGAEDHAGPLPSGLRHAQIWQLPLLAVDGGLQALSRALLPALRA